MPELSRFFGIVIRMYFNNREPPHFRVQYGACRAAISLEGLEVISGELPACALALVHKWASVHYHELLRNWMTLRTKGTFTHIQPLPQGVQSRGQVVSC